MCSSSYRPQIDSNDKTAHSKLYVLPWKGSNHHSIINPYNHLTLVELCCYLQRKAEVQEFDDDFEGVLDIRKEMSDKIEEEAIKQVSKPVATLCNEILTHFTTDPRFQGIHIIAENASLPGRGLPEGRRRH